MNTKLHQCAVAYSDYIEQTGDKPTMVLMEYWFHFNLINEIKQSHGLKQQHTYNFEHQLYGCDIFVVQSGTIKTIQFGKTIKPSYEQQRIRKNTPREIAGTSAHIATSRQARRRKANRKNTSGK